MLLRLSFGKFYLYAQTQALFLYDACVVPLLVEPDTSLVQRRTLCASNRGGIPVAAWEEDGAVLLHGVYQDQVASTVQLDNKDGVAAQGLTYGAHSAVHKAPNLVDVPRESDDNTWPCKNPQRTLRR